MSGSLNIYPFEDVETAIRFVVQVCLFLVGLAVTNKLIIKPALKLQAERKKRTIGSKHVAENKLKHAQELEQSYQRRLSEALEKAQHTHTQAIKNTKETAQSLISNAQKKSNHYLAGIKESLEKEQQDAHAQIHFHISDIVKKVYSKFGVKV